MSRVLLLGLIVSLLGLAVPAAAYEVLVGECTSVVLAYTESPETHVDVYVTDVATYNADPASLQPQAMATALLAAAQESSVGFGEPGEVSQGDVVVQVEIQLPYSDDPELTGIRFTYQVNLNACSGV